MSSSRKASLGHASELNDKEPAMRGATIQTENCKHTVPQNSNRLGVLKQELKGQCGWNIKRNGRISVVLGRV